MLGRLQIFRINENDSSLINKTIVNELFFCLSRIDNLLENDEKRREKQSNKISKLLEVNGCSDAESLRRVAS